MNMTYIAEPGGVCVTSIIALKRPAQLALNGPLLAGPIYALRTPLCDWQSRCVV